MDNYINYDISFDEITYDDNYEDFFNIYNIDIKQNIHTLQLYFSVETIQNEFEFINLNKKILNDKIYTLNDDYIFISCGGVKTLFLTYEGLMRVLFVSKNNKTSKFIKWAVNKLFTIHLGTDEQKNKLISKIKGIEYSRIQEFFSLTPHDISCIYLSSLNDVKTLREKMNIDMKYPDSSIVYKFGLTENLQRRKNEHRFDFKNIENLINIKLIQYSLIDKEFLTRAEKDVKNEFSENIIEYEKMTELIILSNDELKKLKKMYGDLSIKYSGSNINLHDEIKQLKKDIIAKDEKYTNEILQLKKDKNYEYEIFIKNHEIEMLKKTHEIEMLKLELNFYKNK